MKTAKPCRHYTLARNDVAHVQGCTECGCVSVHLGPVTVRLDEASIGALFNVLGEAAAAIHAHHEVRRQASLPGGSS